MRIGVADAHYFRGMALRGLGDGAAAAASLAAGREVAEAIGVRRMLWKILGALALLKDEGEAAVAGSAEELRVEARETIGYIADRVGSEERRVAFLSLPEVDVLIRDM